jgi:hypothetical protein
MGPGGRRTTLAVAAGALVLALTGCGTEAVPVAPRGVDDLQIPTPSPQPGDFVATVDNPWLALSTDTPHTYRDGDETRTVELTGETVDVAGVATAVVHTEEADRHGQTSAAYDELLAQDRAGNVWLFGRLVDSGDLRPWQAGEDGAQAGLLMPARPRRGDGFAVAEARGADQDRALVTSYDGSTLTFTVTSELRPGLDTTLTYERGTGLVEEDGPLDDWVLEP